MIVKKHPQYTLSDYRYFKAKGWIDKEIIARWDAEAREGKPKCSWDTPMAQEKLRSVCCI